MLTVSNTQSTLAPLHKHQRQSDAWIEAYKKEVDTIQGTGYFGVVNRPLKEKVIKILELFVTKHDPLSNSWIAKLHFVAGGDL